MPNPLLYMSWDEFEARRYAYLRRMSVLTWLSLIGTVSIMAAGLLLALKVGDIHVALGILFFQLGIVAGLLFERAFGRHVYLPEVRLWWNIDACEFDELVRKMTPKLFDLIQRNGPEYPWWHYYTYVSDPIRR